MMRTADQKHKEITHTEFDGAKKIRDLRPEEMKRHAEEMQDIISAPPSWLLSWGIFMFFLILSAILGLAAFIRYPDVVKVPLRINALNCPQIVTVKITDRLIKILVHNNQEVSTGQSIAYLESSADPEVVLSCFNTLKNIRSQLGKGKSMKGAMFDPDLRLGELQNSYQLFYNALFKYKMNNNGKLGFVQAVNKMITDIEVWKGKYILSAPQKGRLSYSSAVREGQFVTPNQEGFYIDPGHTSFYGEMGIPENVMSKIKIGQSVLVKLKRYPFEEYGILEGKISYISDLPYRDGVFISKVSLSDHNAFELSYPGKLKSGMNADAEIITSDISLLKRLVGNSFNKIR